MRRASKRIPDRAEKTVRDIRRNTRRHHSAEEKIGIVLEGLRGEVSIAELCRKEGINQNLYPRSSKEFLEAGKKRLGSSSDVAEVHPQFRPCHPRQRVNRAAHLLMPQLLALIRAEPIARHNLTLIPNLGGVRRAIDLKPVRPATDIEPVQQPI